MGDIKRNDTGKTVQVTEKEVQLDTVTEKKNMFKVEFGNVETVKIKMLESVNINLLEIIKLLQEIKDKK